MKTNLSTAILTVGALIFAGCTGQKVEPKKQQPPKKVEENITAVIIEEEPIFELEPYIPPPPPQIVVVEEEKEVEDIYQWNQNDELVEKRKASKIVVVKSKRVMVLLDENNNLLSRHRISLGESPEGKKIKRGDKKTPEGVYKIIDKRNDKKYYKELLISYPNAEDKIRAKELGVNPGSGITIHAQVPMFWNGKGDDYTLSHDWTNGCMAMTNTGINTIWNMVPLGTTVEIKE
jgi:murein L,D-transpeptidase YafK